MRYLISAHAQNTPEWYAVRAGRGTGSRAECYTAKGRGGGPSVTRANYIAQLATERITGTSLDENGFQSPDMLRGKQLEPEARTEHEAETGELVEQVGFVYWPDMPVGCSPDGFVSERRGLVGFKCPKLAVHIGYLFAGRVPPEYVPQTTHELWITDAEFFDFVSYCPQAPEGLRLFRVRAYRQEFDIAAHETSVIAFMKEVDALELKMRERLALLKRAA